MSGRVTACVAVLILLLAGWAGLRPGTNPDASGAIGKAIARAGSIPLAFPDWVGRESDTDLAQFRGMGIEGGLARLYRHRRSGRAVSILLVFGAPGPISVHTPEHCMVAAGFRTAGPPELAEVSRRDGPPDRFLRRLFAAPAPEGGRSQEIYWSWGADPHWDVPLDPRMTFADRPYLSKLYAARFATGDDGPSARAELESLVAEFLDAFDRPPR